MIQTWHGAKTDLKNHEFSLCIILDYTKDVYIYRKISNIRRTKSQNLNDSRLVLHSSLPNLLKRGVK